MTFYSKFSDYKGKVYGLEMTVRSAQGADTNLTMSGNPCVIETSSSKLFDPIKSRSCSLEIVTGDWYFQLYEPTSRGTTVKVYEYDESYQNNVKEVIFIGYLTPASYDQTWTYKDTITLEAVDAISTTKDFKWVSDGTYKTFLDIILSILQSDNINGYQGKLYVPRTYTYINEDHYAWGDDVLGKLMSSSGNFIDDDDEHTPWTHYDILEEILKFLGWSLVPNGDDVWLIDYRAEGEQSEIDYSVYDIRTGQQLAYPNSPYTSEDGTVNLNLDKLAPGTTSISIDDVYNKIEISDNLYKIDEISPDIFDDGYHINVTEEIEQMDPAYSSLQTSKWVKTQTKGILFWKETQETTQGWYYQTLCRLNDNSGWTHKYYHMNNLSEIPLPAGTSNENDHRFYDSTSNKTYTTGLINKWVTSHCALIQHYAFVKEQGNNNLPPTLDWTDTLTFFVMDDSINAGQGKINLLDAPNYEKPVLEYNIDEEIQWKPSSGTSWLTIKGDLFYQYNGAKYGEKKKKKNTLNTINVDKRYVFTAPVDKLDTIPDADLYSLGRTPQHADYGKGFQMWKFRLQIGDYYWSGSKWVYNSPRDFYISYNNDPDPNAEEDKDKNEYMPAFKWVSTLNNNDYKDKVGVDGYAIPIKFDDDNAPTRGKLKLTVYTPAIMSPDMIDLFRQLHIDSYTAANWSDLCPVIFAKGFEFGYVYTDSRVWWDNHDSQDNADRVFTGNINDNYVKTFDTMQLKINTVQKDQPISRSYVITKLPTNNNSYVYPYLTKMKHQCSADDKEQEFNVVDAYLDHHSERKPIIEANVHDWQHPLTKYSKNQISGTFVLDSQSWNVRENNNRIKIISF